MARSMRCATPEIPTFELISEETFKMYWMEEVPHIITQEAVDKYYLEIKCLSQEGLEQERRRLLQKIDGDMFFKV